MDKLTVNQVKESLAPTFDKVQGFEETTADFGLTTHKEFISTLVAFSQDFEMERKDFYNYHQGKISIVGEKKNNCIHVFATKYCLPLHRVFRAYVKRDFILELDSKKLSELLKLFPKYEYDFQIECENEVLSLRYKGTKYDYLPLTNAVETINYHDTKLGYVEESFFQQNYEQTSDMLFSVSNLEDLVRVAKNLNRKFIRIVSGPNNVNGYVANIVSTDKKDFEETPVIALFRGYHTF